MASSCLSSCPHLPRPRALVYLGMDTTLRHLNPTKQDRTSTGQGAKLSPLRPCLFSSVHETKSPDASTRSLNLQSHS